MRIVVIRHGQRCDEFPGAPVASVPGAHHAAYPEDPPLTLEGVRQAQMAAEHISFFVQKSYDVDVVYSSPMVRCAQTAYPLARALNRPLILEPNIGVCALRFKRALEAGSRPSLLAVDEFPLLRDCFRDVEVSYDGRSYPKCEDDFRVMAEQIARQRESESGGTSTQKAVLLVTHREGIRYLDRLCGEEVKHATPYCACHEYDFDVTTSRWSLVHNSKILKPQPRTKFANDSSFAYPSKELCNLPN